MPVPVPTLARNASQLLTAVVLLSFVAVAIYLSTHSSQKAQASTICHPSLSHLRGTNGQEVVLIGTLSLDLDNTSGTLVRDTLNALQPDVVMVEGTWTAGVNAMLLSGRWELHGAPPAPGTFNWTDTGDAEPVELPRPKRRGFLSFTTGTKPRWPQRSLVPVKVGNWAYFLRGSVGGDIAAALTAAAASGVPVHFLGPKDGGFQGHVQVSLLAQQAAMELLSEEQERGAQLAPEDVDAALRRAEAHVRREAGKWEKDARGETSKLMDHLQNQVAEKVRNVVEERLEARVSYFAERIAKTMEAHQRGVVVLSVDQLVAVEAKLMNNGYTYIGQCT